MHCRGSLLPLPGALTPGAQIALSSSRAQRCHSQGPSARARLSATRLCGSSGSTSRGSCTRPRTSISRTCTWHPTACAGGACTQSWASCWASGCRTARGGSGPLRSCWAASPQACPGRRGGCWPPRAGSRGGWRTQGRCGTSGLWRPLAGSSPRATPPRGPWQRPGRAAAAFRAGSGRPLRASWRWSTASSARWSGGASSAPTASSWPPWAPGYRRPSPLTRSWCSRCPSCSVWPSPPTTN
mmetsp:Transcript_51794/g.165798  ORF Transcript_51794/g.165798 Transcript_51794/m.165798 type:complete len:241 (+) Transcript_51794:341-1063(+)